MVDFTNEKIEQVADFKTNDYVQDILVKILISKYDNPLKEAHKLKDTAIKQCTYDDPTVDKAVYDKLQSSINKNTLAYFDKLIAKIEDKIEDL